MSLLKKMTNTFGALSSPKTILLKVLPNNEVKINFEISESLGNKDFDIALFCTQYGDVRYCEYKDDTKEIKYQNYNILENINIQNITAEEICIIVSLIFPNETITFENAKAKNGILETNKKYQFINNKLMKNGEFIKWDYFHNKGVKVFFDTNRDKKEIYCVDQNGNEYTFKNLIKDFNKSSQYSIGFKNDTRILEVSKEGKPVLTGLRYAKNTLINKEFADLSDSQNCEFESCIIFEQDFKEMSGSFFENCIFYNCNFLENGFSQSCAKSTIFKDCEFIGCENPQNGMDSIPKYNVIHNFVNGFAAIELQEKWGFINERHKEICKPTYEWVGNFSESYASVSLNNKMGFINQKGKVVIPIIYDDVEDFKNGVAKVFIDNEHKVINFRGEIVSPL